MNKVILIGRLTKDPEVRYTQGQETMAVARYTLAVDRNRKQENGQNTDFINCISFKKNAEFAEKFLHKGTKIAVIGRIQTGSYTNKDGQKVYTTDVVVDEQEFVESKKNTQPAPEPAPAGGYEGFMNIPDGVEDEGLPFN